MNEIRSENTGENMLIFKHCTIKGLELSFLRSPQLDYLRCDIYLLVNKEKIIKRKTIKTTTVRCTTV